jgi:hypothetical protein
MAALANPSEKLQKAVLALEKKRKSRIFCIVHGGDSHICGPTLWSVIKRRREFENLDTLELLLHSPGGHADLAYQLMKYFRRKAKTVNVIVPFAAKSAATLMCLGADAVFMGQFAELGPLDVQIEDPVEKGAEPVSPIDDFKSMEFLREYAVELLDYFTLNLVKRYGISLKDAIPHSTACATGLVGRLYEKIDPLEVGGHRRSLAIGEEYAKRLLTLVKNPNHKAIVEKLVWSYPSHDFAVDFDEALELGLPVKHLDGAQDDALIDGLREVMSHEITFYGFVERPKASTRPQKRSAPKVKKTTAKRPVQSAGIAGERLAS